MSCFFFLVITPRCDNGCRLSTKRLKIQGHNLGDESNLPRCQGQRRMFLWKIQARLQFGGLVVAVFRFGFLTGYSFSRWGQVLWLYLFWVVWWPCMELSWLQCSAGPHPVHPATDSSSQYKPLLFSTLSKVVVHTLCALTSDISQVQVIPVKVLMSGICAAYGTDWVTPTVMGENCEPENCYP